MTARHLRTALATALILLTLPGLQGKQAYALAPRHAVRFAQDNAQDLAVIAVVDETGRAAPGVAVYAGGALLRDGRGARRGQAVTDSAGEIHVEAAQVITAPVALAQQAVWTATDSAHVCSYRDEAPCPSQQPWSYAVYQTNLDWSDDGSSTTRAQPTENGWRLTLGRKHPLILFNLVVALDWSATPEYRASLEKGLRLASDTLFDLTDGQMAFGQVAIDDGGTVWELADVQMSRDNTICPHASIGGLTGTPKAGAIRLGPFWDGRYTSGGGWGDPNGYRTIAHEFAHYALGLYDEYFTPTKDPVYCTEPFEDGDPVDCKEPFEDGDRLCAARRASAMSDQRYATEFSARTVKGLWSPACEQTKHFAETQQSTWETIADRFADSASPARWLLETPMSRKTIMAGPESDQWPPALPHWPAIRFLSGQDPEVKDLWMKIDTGQCTQDPATLSHAVVKLKPGAQKELIALGTIPVTQGLRLVGVTAGDLICVSVGGCVGDAAIDASMKEVTVSVRRGGLCPSTTSYSNWNAQPVWSQSPASVTSSNIPVGPLIPQIVAVDDDGVVREIGNALDVDLTALPNPLEEIAEPGLGSGDLYLTLPPPNWTDLAPQPPDQLLGTYVQLGLGDTSGELASVDGRFNLMPLPTDTLPGVPKMLPELQPSYLIHLQVAPSLPLDAGAEVVVQPALVATPDRQPVLITESCISGPNDATGDEQEAGEATPKQARQYRAVRYDDGNHAWTALDTPVVVNSAARSLSFVVTLPGIYAVVALPAKAVP